MGREEDGGGMYNVNSSPLTDLGGNSSWDITGVPNATNGLDIGAYEYQGTAGVYGVIGASSCN